MKALWAVACVFAFVVLCLAERALATHLNPKSADAIAKLQQDKSLRTEQQQKLESSLLLELRVLQNDPSLSLVEEAAPRIMEGIRRTIARRTRGEIDAPLVDIRLKETVSEAGVSAVAEKVKKLRVEVLEVHKEPPSLAARVHAIEDLQDIIDLPQVESVSTVRRNFAQRLSSRPAAASRKHMAPLRHVNKRDERSEHTSEGVQAHRVDQLPSRPPENPYGSGVKVCVISDGVDSLSESQEAGDLPYEVEILDYDESDDYGSGDTGTAMLEVIHDIAPGANLCFAAAPDTQEKFGAMVDQLAGEGCQIIVDGFFYYDEPPFQDGTIARSVTKFANDGGLYFVAAGDLGHKCYEGDYDETLYGSSNPVDEFNSESSLNSFKIKWKDQNTFEYPLQLTWNDPWNGNTNELGDYDLFVLVNGGGTLGKSMKRQGVPPIETVDQVDSTYGGEVFVPSANALVVRNSDSDPRYIRLVSFGCDLTYYTDGCIYGHAAAKGAFAVTAIDVINGAGSTLSFYGQSSLSVKDSSSTGPRRMFYDDNGVSYTTGLYLESEDAGEVRENVPFIAAADCVSTSVNGPNGFCGTNAAAAHAAGLAAILLSARPELSRDEVKEILKESTIDTKESAYEDETGFNYYSGYGVLDAVKMACAAGIIPDTDQICLNQATETEETPEEGRQIGMGAIFGMILAGLIVFSIVVIILVVLNRRYSSASRAARNARYMQMVPSE